DGGTDAVASDAGPCVDCLTASISWGWNGGLVQYVDQSTLAACRAYSHTRSGGPVGQDASALPSCSSELGNRGAVPIAVRDVERALPHTDVIAAFARPGIPIYGFDTRPVDGSLHRITVGAKSIDVGNDCNASSQCTPVPPGVRALTDLLVALDTQELA